MGHLAGLTRVAADGVSWLVVGPATVELVTSPLLETLLYPKQLLEETLAAELHSLPKWPNDEGKLFQLTNTCWTRSAPRAAMRAWRTCSGASLTVKSVGRVGVGFQDSRSPHFNIFFDMRQAPFPLLKREYIVCSKFRENNQSRRKCLSPLVKAEDLFQTSRLNQWKESDSLLKRYTITAII